MELSLPDWLTTQTTTFMVVAFVVSIFLVGVLLGFLSAKAYFTQITTQHWLNSDWSFYRSWQRASGRFHRATVFEYTNSVIKGCREEIAKYQSFLHRSQHRPTLRSVDKLPDNVTPLPKKDKT
jgi:ABC-type uncharacterized transport system involved in gliding motility auxiliary subunit